MTQGETVLLLVAWFAVILLLGIPVYIGISRYMRHVERHRIELDQAMRRHPAGKKRPT